MHEGMSGYTYQNETPYVYVELIDIWISWSKVASVWLEQFQHINKQDNQDNPVWSQVTIGPFNWSHSNCCNLDCACYMWAKRHSKHSPSTHDGPVLVSWAPLENFQGIHIHLWIQLHDHHPLHNSIVHLPMCPSANFMFPWLTLKDYNCICMCDNCDKCSWELLVYEP